MSETLAKSVDAALAERERKQRVNNYWDRPDLWVEYMLGEKMWAKQKEIADSVVANRANAVKAGHGLGKSWLVSALIVWWVDTRFPNAFVASTAPSTAQIGAIVWKEIRRMYSTIEKRYNAGLIDHKLPGKINADNKNNEWKASDGQLIGFGRKPPDGKEDDNFQGIHDAYVLAVGDESVGLSEEMIDALGNITSNRDSRRIIISNPTNPASYTGTIFKEDKGWTLHTISCFDSPNVTGETSGLSEFALSKLVGPEYIEDKKVEYGENSARYKARVLGEFAFDLGNALIEERDIAPALDTHLQVRADTRPDLGVDVARYGDDKSVVYSFQDGVLRYIDSWEKASGTESATRIHKIAKDTGARFVKIDAAGLGGPIADQVAQMAEAEGSYTVIEMVGGGASPDKRFWYNVRAYWWDKFKDALRNSEIDLDIEDERLRDELMSVEYKYAPNGGLLIESKDDMRKRPGMKSPDFADAAIYAASDISFLFDGRVPGAQDGDIVSGDPDFYNTQENEWWIGW